MPEKAMLLRLWGCLVAVCLFTGCDSGLKLVPVSGIVTLDDRPLPFKSMMFLPEEGTPGHGGGGSTRKDGTYSLIASIPGETTDRSGVTPGRYRVIVFEPVIPITEELAVQPAEGSELTPAIAPDFRPRKRAIPAVYTTQESTPLVFDVPESGAVIEVKLNLKVR
jgi:hypothetical protein